MSKKIELKASAKAASKPARMVQLGAELQKSYGPRAAVMGSEKPALDVIPTGCLALDYELGTGGIARGHATGIFGKRDIGKSVTALNIVANAQAQGLDVVWLAVETSFDAEWAEKHGVDTSALLVAFPKTGEEAFQMMYRCIEAEVGLVIFDSVGALLGESEIGVDAKARTGGQAGLITWGMKMCVPAAYHSNTALVFLNQQRDDMAARYAGAVKQPGGHTLEHMEATIIHLKAGGAPFKTKIRGSEVEIGKPIIAHIVRNKLSEGSSRKALYDMYYMETEDYPFGVDKISDIINTGKRAGVIKQAGSIYTLPDGMKCKGAKAVAQHLVDKPLVYDLIRAGIMEAMEEAYGPVHQVDPVTSGDED